MEVVKMSEDRKDIAKLAEKLAQIGAEIGKMENDGRNTSGGGGYEFISYKAMEAKLRALAQKHNVAFIPQFNDYEETELSNNMGKKYMRSVVKGKMIIVCGDTGATLEGAFIGGEQDYGGKSMGQAETEATKRFYFKLFHVSDMEVDPDQNTFDPDKKDDNKPDKKKKEEENTPKEEKPDNSKLIALLVSTAKVKGYTEQEAYKPFKDGINNYSTEQIQSVINDFLKKPHKKTKWLNVLAKETDITIVNIQKKCQEKYSKPFEELTTDEMAEIKKILEGEK